MRIALRLLTTCACVLVIQAAWAGNTGKIVGKVTDAKSKDPLVGVNILVVGAKQGAATDTQGDYFILNVLPGTYTLRASAVGFRDVVTTGVQVNVDATTEINVRMEQTVLDLGQEIIVTAERPLVQKDNTSTRVFIGSGEINNRPVAVVSEVVSTLPSVNFENGALMVRGGGLSEVSFLIDGARAWNPVNQQPYTNVNLSSIQEMEVITGSYNAEYGEARSGIFNIITKEGSEKYQFYVDTRYTPPGVKHWGPSLYDQSTPVYWENTHARHLQWWIDNPEQWVDNNGVYGNDPRCSFSPEQAYADYMSTHRPLTDYTKTPGIQTELSIGGPFPLIDKVYFHLSGKYRSEPPIMGNAFYDKGIFYDFNGKLTYQLDQKTKFMMSWFYGSEKTAWGIGGGPDYGWATDYGVSSRYAYFDFEGLPASLINSLTAKMTHIVDEATMYEVKGSMTYTKVVKGVFPGDPIGWDALEASYDNLRAVEPYWDSTGIHYRAVPGGNQNRIGYHTTGYYDRHEDRNTTWNLTGFYSSQINKYWQLKAGGEFTYYNINHFNESKLPPRVDDHIYNPYQGASYVQSKLEFSGFIMNLGLRFDFYNANDVAYPSLFNPLGSPTEKSKMFTKLSPRLGVSHPIDEYTVLHFSYGHFFQRPSFGDYGEGNDSYHALGLLTTFIVKENGYPWVLGNRNVKPEQTIAFELGIERNFFDEFVVGVTAYYKDIRDLVFGMTVVDSTPRPPYRTNANLSYGDVRGLEISLRKQSTRRDWGTLWGYANFTTQIGIAGRTGAPQAITYDRGPLYATSGDNISYNNPRLKAGIYYQTPTDWDVLGGILSKISVSADYIAVFPNDQLLSDFFALWDGRKFVRSADQNTNLRVRKDFSLGGDRVQIGVYVEIRNLFNDQWVNLAAFKGCTPQDQERFATSDFTYLPSTLANGAPILDLAKFRNLPRSFVLGATLEL